MVMTVRACRAEMHPWRNPVAAADGGGVPASALTSTPIWCLYTRLPISIRVP
jgi:hypothetical protein